MLAAVVNLLYVFVALRYGYVVAQLAWADRKLAKAAKTAAESESELGGETAHEGMGEKKTRELAKASSWSAGIEMTVVTTRAGGNSSLDEDSPAVEAQAVVLAATPSASEPARPTCEAAEGATTTWVRKYDARHQRHYFVRMPYATWQVLRACLS